MYSYFSVICLSSPLCLICPSPHFFSTMYSQTFPSQMNISLLILPSQGLLLLYHWTQPILYEYYLCTCVSLIWLWTLRLEGLYLPSSLPPFFPLSLLFSFLTPFLYLFLIHSVRYSIVIHLTVSLAFFSVNVPEPESRFKVDQLQRHPRM